MKSALRFCLRSHLLKEMEECVAGSGNLRVGDLQAAGIVVEQVESSCHQTD